MIPSQDRKDPPIQSAKAPLPESADMRSERKSRESELLDEAILETFPASDPVSPFVPAKGVLLEGEMVEGDALESDAAVGEVETIGFGQRDIETGASSADAAVGGSADIETAHAGGGVEQVGGDGQEQIDPGADGKPII